MYMEEIRKHTVEIKNGAITQYCLYTVDGLGVLDLVAVSTTTYMGPVEAKKYIEQKRDEYEARGAFCVLGVTRLEGVDGE